MKSDTPSFIDTPLVYSETDSTLHLQNKLTSEIAMLDKLIDLIVFTPRGSFESDPEFGFEYWNHEYTNIRYESFNNAQAGVSKGRYQNITKIECQDSVRYSLQVYAPQLKNVNVAVEINPAISEKLYKRKTPSKHLVSVLVKGELDNGISVSDYKKKIDFLMEPTSKRQTY